MSELIIRAILKDEFSAAAQKLIQELNQIASTGATAGASLRAGMSSALPTVQGVTDALGQQNAQLRAQIQAYKSDAGAHYLQEQRALRAEIDQLTNSGQKQSMTWADIASKYYLAAQAAGIVASATMAVVDAASRYDSIKMRIDAFEGSAEAGARAFAKLQELAKQPGLGLEQASSAYAALRALKESGPEAVAIIEAVARANASMGGGAEEFGRAMVQIQQMLGKGKLMAEDINTISESIPNFRALIMDAFGTTDAKALNAKYSIQELLRGVEEAAAKLPPPGETIKNNMDNIGDAWTRLKASLGNSDAIKSATGALAKFLDVLATANENEDKASANVSRIIGRENMGAFSREGSMGTSIANSASGGWDNVAKYGSQMDMMTSMRTQFAQQNEAKAKEQMAKDSKLAEERAETAKRDAKKFADAQREILESRLQFEADQYNELVRRRAELRAKTPGERIGAGETVNEEHVSTVSGKTYSGYAQIGIMSSTDMKADRKAYDEWSKGQDEKRKKLAQVNKEIIRQEEEVAKAHAKIEKAQTRATQEEARKRLAIQTAVYGRIADAASSSLMVGFQPLDDIYSRMAARNQEMEDSFTKTFQGIALSFATMMTKMAEELATRAAVFGLFSLIPGMGGASGILGGAGSFIFGARASGGAMFPGVPYRYNEDRYGGGGEIFRPSTSGTSSPDRGNGGGSQVVYNFAAGTSRADAGYIVRSIEQATRERRRTVSRAL